MKVLIDPGHAPGNVNGGLKGYKEYAAMWKLSNFLKDILVSSGVSADLTRTENQDPSLAARGGKAQGYNLFISEHSNAYNGSVRGCECFYSVARPNDKTTAAMLSAAVATLMNNPDRGAKTRTGTGGADYYGVINAAIKAGCPHVFLIESGFHDNWLDEDFLLIDDNLIKIAEVQAKVILEALGVVNPPKPTPPSNNTPNNDLSAAVDVLVKNGVIGSPDYWLTNHNKLQYVDSLIINMAKKLLD